MVQDDRSRYWHPASLSGRRAIVTGAAQGVGRGITQALLERGAAVLLVDRNAAVVIVLTLLWVPRSHDSASPPVDRVSALLWWGALSTAILAIVEGPQRGWDSPLVLLEGVLAVGLFVGFLKWEDR